MSKIRILPEHIINLIAAGEVVERPASALKELIENSIDAKSSKIIVRLEEQGTKLIEVEDNGAGMDLEDAKLAFTQHATSKIFNEEDLNQIKTLGFRGEALASIAAVSEKAILETKTKDSKAVKLNFLNNKINEDKSARTEAGTTISIYNLFEKVPARKKFLKAPNTEYKHILTTFINTALIHTDIHFEIHHNDKLIYRLTKTESFKERIFELFGKDISNNLTGPIEYKNNFCNITLYLGDPKIAKKTVTNQVAFINNRYITDKVIQGAISNGFSGFIHKELKPVWFVFIHINSELVDVNVHPRKMEVRFTNPKDIYGILYSLTKKTLEQQSKTVTIESLSENTYKVPAFVFKESIKSDKSNYAPKSSEDTRFKAKQFNVNQALSFSEALLNGQKPVEQNINEGIDTFQPGSVLQIFNTYIVYEQNNAMIVVDQHAASEKITFEKLIANVKSIKPKPLLIPKIIDLNQAQKKELIELQPELIKIGLTINDFGGDSIQISEIPEFINDFDLEGLIFELLDEPSEFKKTYSEFQRTNNSLSEKIYLILATTACHGSIRAGQRLNEVEMKNIVKDLLKLENPYSCPHGRPVFWKLEKADLEKNFKRTL